MRDISNVVANEDLMIRGLTFTADEKANIAYVKITIEIENLDSLSGVLAKINKIPNVVEVIRSV